MNDRDKSLEGEERMHERMEARSPHLHSSTRKRMMAHLAPKWRSGYLKIGSGDFPGDPVVKNLLSNAEDMGLIPGQGT